MYSKELNAIKKANRFRQRIIHNQDLIDLASNDYLGLACNKDLLHNAYIKVSQLSSHSPKASMLVNGYSEIHQEFEQNLINVNHFEDAIIVGSGFLANLAMFDALIRKTDILFIDEEYHASGMFAIQHLKKEQVHIFRHNDAEHLESLLKETSVKGRRIIAIEGVYSMHGDLANKDIFTLANKYSSLLIVDEAHSSGVLGDDLFGIFDYYNINVEENHIKMGTLGKSYGSYGAYILASSHIISFLQNRAKAMIYTTAPSLFDTALGNEALSYIIKNKKTIKEKIKKNLNIIEETLGIKSKSLIIPIIINDNKKVIEIQNYLKEKGFLVGAIRQPTVKKAIIRLIAKIDVSEHDLQEVCNLLKGYINE